MKGDECAWSCWVDLKHKSSLKSYLENLHDHLEKSWIKIEDATDELKQKNDVFKIIGKKLKELICHISYH